jgi:hypothetical protein
MKRNEKSISKELKKASQLINSLLLHYTIIKNLSSLTKKKENERKKEKTVNFNP